MEPNIKIEELQWQKRIFVPGAVSGLLLPDSMAVSTASAPIYRWAGKQRSRSRGMAVFQYTLSGHGVFVLDDEPVPVDAGTGFCCYVGDPRIQYYYPEWGREPWRFLYVSYSDEPGITRALNERFGYVFTIAPEEQQIRQLLHYGNTAESVVEMRAGAAHVFINSIIGMLVDRTQRYQEPPGARIRLVRRALHVIEARLAIPFNAAMLADELGVSQEHLNRSFRQEMGITPYQSICKSKIYRACEQLKNTNSTIAEIAISMGYTPGAHFARLFKRMTGITPGEFRRGSSLPQQPF
jgi:AraC family transcriptional regulator, arabinose operon regulatory protein